ncbi:MAG TPA: three component ABC system middle component [Terriglobales bacterium]|jgi:hypothetical protein|nr:three component ABC system middle component [Terriglobales bacterium]
MIDILFEQRVTQNTGLAAEAIWQAVHEAYDGKGRTEGLPFPLSFLVLPLTFHSQTATTLAAKSQPAALYKAIGENREITVGLQARMQAMADRTMKALSIAFHSGLLLLDQDPERHLIPGRKTQPVTHSTEEARMVLAAARRVGQAFAEMSIVQISAHLNIRF